jgi:hypothetical protein
MLELAKQLGNVTCKMMGYIKDLYDKGGEHVLQEISRKKPVLKNRVPQEIEDATVALAVEQPTFGRVRIVSELRKRRLTVSSAGVRYVWLRHDPASAQEKAKTKKEAHGAFDSEHPGYCGARTRYMAAI